MRVPTARSMLGGSGGTPPWKILKNGGCRCILRASETYISKNFKLILGAKIVIFEIKIVIFEIKIVIFEIKLSF